MTTDQGLHYLALAEALVRQPSASMEQLAHTIGVSRATLHRMVSSRDELIRKLSEHALESCSGIFAELHLDKGPADEALQRMVAALNPKANLFLFLHRHGLAHARAMKESDWLEQRKRLVAFFQRGQEEGVFRIDVSASWLVDALGALLRAAGEAAYEERLARADMNHVVCSVLLDGVRRRPS